MRDKYPIVLRSRKSAETLPSFDLTPKSGWPDGDPVPSRGIARLQLIASFKEIPSRSEFHRMYCSIKQSLCCRNLYFLNPRHARTQTKNQITQALVYLARFAQYSKRSLSGRGTRWVWKLGWLRTCSLSALSRRTRDSTRSGFNVRHINGPKNSTSSRTICSCTLNGSGKVCSPSFLACSSASSCRICCRILSTVMGSSCSGDVGRDNSGEGTLEDSLLVSSSQWQWQWQCPGV